MKLSILIPVYNENKTVLRNTISTINKLPVDTEIIIYNDGSVVTYCDLLEDKQLNISRLVECTQNHGKGYAIRAMISFATGDYCIVQDADGELNPNDIPKLIKATKCNLYNAVYGYRDFSKCKPLYRFGNKFLNWFLNNLYPIYVTQVKDLECGYKLIRTSLLKSLNLQSDGFNIESEITCKLLNICIPIQQVPVSYTPRTNGKKMKVHYGLSTLWTIVKYRFL